MTDRPILMSGPMVRAILDGRKTQTRRGVVNLLGFGPVTQFGPSTTAGFDWHFRRRDMCWNDLSHEQLLAACPYGRPGNRLWTREAFLGARGYDCDPPSRWGNKPIWYPADGKPDRDKWWFLSSRARPSIHMPRCASRLTLELTDVRVERVQDISEGDANAEGLEQSVTQIMNNFEYTYRGCHDGDWTADHQEAFADLWDTINVNRPGYSWAENPYVWCLSFKVIKANIDQIGEHDG